MRLMFASDIHGSACYCRKMLEAFEEEKASRLILLGDILYHGPRNDLPKEYNPKEVIQLLNKRKEFIYAVRGNCDSEVDQMVLEFPIMADYSIIMDGAQLIYATHGHTYNKGHLPPIKQGDILIHGHTHIPAAKRETNYILLNPGSVSLPKEGNPPSYGIWDEGIFQIKDFTGRQMKELAVSSAGNGE
jgi:putative phosphoesterase